MKQTLLSVFFCCIFISLKAQSSFPTTDSLSINNINATFMVHGDMWNGPDTVKSHCYFPSSTRKSVCAAGALWMSGYDNANTLHVAAQTYRQDGNDYWPGPLLSTSAITYGYSYKWAKIWKVNRAEIQAFRLTAIHTVDNTPEAILTWPASGNIYAKGNMGVELSIPVGVALAPFEDLNANGIYEPLLGDYPKVKGDQALWWVFNDDGPQHIVTSSPPLHAEVQAMAYSYKRNNAVDNAIFIEYKVINKGTFNYDSFRLAQFADLDLGEAQDDYIGFDSVRGMGIVYNSDLFDGFSTWDTVYTYGSKPPMAGVLLLDLSQSLAGVNNVGSFTYFTNDATVAGTPNIGVHYSNYSRSRWFSGFHFRNDFAGAGINSSGGGSGPDTKYVFSGDPGISTEWSECVCNNFPRDMRVILSSKDLRFDAGDTVFMAISLLVKADTSSLGCPNASFAPIKSLADSIIYFYHNPPATFPLNIIEHEVDHLKIYPNPATNYLTIELQDNISQGIVNIYDPTGRHILSSSISTAQKIIDISSLVPGIYYLKCNVGNTIFNSVVVKH